MSFTPPSALSLLAFEGLLVAVSVAGLIAVYTATRSPRATGTAGVVWVAWLGALSAAVASGWFQAAPFPRLIVYFLGSNLFALALACSPLGGRLPSVGAGSPAAITA